MDRYVGPSLSLCVVGNKKCFCFCGKFDCEDFLFGVWWREVSQLLRFQTFWNGENLFLSLYLSIQRDWTEDSLYNHFESVLCSIHKVKAAFLLVFFWVRVRVRVREDVLSLSSLLVSPLSRACFSGFENGGLRVKKDNLMFNSRSTVWSSLSLEHAFRVLRMGDWWSKRTIWV